MKHKWNTDGTKPQIIQVYLSQKNPHQLPCKPYILSVQAKYTCIVQNYIELTPGSRFPCPTQLISTSVSSPFKGLAHILYIYIYSNAYIYIYVISQNRKQIRFCMIWPLEISNSVQNIPMVCGSNPQTRQAQFRQLCCYTVVGSDRRFKTEWRFKIPNVEPWQSPWSISSLYLYVYILVWTRGYPSSVRGGAELSDWEFSGAGTVSSNSFFE
jgi:hypothetical protein